MKKNYFLFVIVVLASYTQVSAEVRYVKETGSGSGSSWADASGDLQLMINASVSGDEIWVAQGTYKPVRSVTDLTTITLDDRVNAFVLKAGVKLLGGFPSDNNAATREHRDPIGYLTLLSGDIGTPGDIADNTYHVVIVAEGEEPAEMNGFTITGGNANNTSLSSAIGTTTISHYLGGGIYIRGALTLSQCIITANTTTNYGGGIYSSLSGTLKVSDTQFLNNTAGNGGAWYSQLGDLQLSNLIFEGNSATSSGGGWYNFSGSPKITDVTFKNNKATGTGFTSFNSFPDPLQGGGGFYNGSGDPQLTNVVFELNSGFGGGGFFNGFGNPRLKNVTFKSNTAAGTFAGYGGGWFNRDGAPELTEVTFYKNSAQTYGGGFSITGGAPRLVNVIFEENSAQNGGGIDLQRGYTNSGAGYEKNSNIVILNAIFTRNSSGTGGGIRAWQGTLTLVNSTISGNSATTTNADVYNNNANVDNLKLYNSVIWPGGGYNSAFNIASNVSHSILGSFRYTTNGGGAFIGSTAVLDTETLRLVAASPAVDAGLNSLYTDAGGDLAGKDLAGNVRLAASNVDLGAYEYASSPLPVTLAGFKAAKVENTALLTWKTTAEVNVSHFEIERSSDAGSWQTVGSVAAKGGSIRPESYEFSDLLPATGYQPNQRPAATYYKLRMVDRDGSYSYSNIVSVTWEGWGTALSVYPNPVSSTQSLMLQGTAGASGWSIVNVNGHTLRSGTLNGNTLVLPVADLRPGVYFIRLNAVQGPHKPLRFVKE